MLNDLIKVKKFWFFEVVQISIDPHLVLNGRLEKKVNLGRVFFLFFLQKRNKNYHKRLNIRELNLVLYET